MVFLKSAFGHFQGQKSELAGAWEVIITRGVGRVLLSVINAGGVEGWLHRGGFVVIIPTLLFLPPFCSLAFPAAVVPAAFLQRSVLAAFCGFDLPPGSPEGGMSLFLDTRAGSAPLEHRNLPHISRGRVSYLGDLSCCRSPPSAREGNSVNNPMWKELTPIREPTDLTGGKALVGCEFPAN